jgi:DNA-binding transcriptional regulator YhcF (GntR family)
VSLALHHADGNVSGTSKIVAALIDHGLLAVRPGIGTIVSSARQSSGRRALLEEAIEKLVVEARWGALTLADLLAAVKRHWSRTVRRAG